MSEEQPDRSSIFQEAQSLADEDRVGEALDLIQPYLEDKELEFESAEMAVISNVLVEKITSSGFGDEKKEACADAIEALEGMKLVKESGWLNSYVDAVYEACSKMNRCAREEERENMWCRLKEMYLEILMTARKVWKDKNHLERLGIYLSLSKLCKSYLDVADDETMKICEDAAKEAKFMGKGAMEDEEWRDANRIIEDIKKHISDARHEKELLEDE